MIACFVSWISHMNEIIWYLSFSNLLFFKILFIYLRERESTSWGSGRRRGRSKLFTEQRAWHRIPSQGPGIMTWTKGRHLTNWATQAPLWLILLNIILSSSSHIIANGKISFFWLNNIPCVCVCVFVYVYLYIHTTFSWPIHHLMDIWAFSLIWLSFITLL